MLVVPLLQVLVVAMKGGLGDIVAAVLTYVDSYGDGHGDAVSVLVIAMLQVLAMTQVMAGGVISVILVTWCKCCRCWCVMAAVMA